MRSDRLIYHKVKGAKLWLTILLSLSARGAMSVQELGEKKHVDNNIFVIASLILCACGCRAVAL